MKRLQIIIPVLIVFLLPLALTSIAKAETRWVWGFLYEGMDLDIYAPYQGYAGDTITVRVRVEAKEDLRDIYIKVSLYGSKSVGYAGWSTYFYALYDVDLSTGVIRDNNFNIGIPSDVDSGLIYGYAECDWKVYRVLWWEDRSRDGLFNVVYLRNLLDERDYWRNEYFDMKSDRDYYKGLAEYWVSEYWEMKSDRDYWKNEFNELNSTYNELNSTYNELNSTYIEYKQTHSYTNTEYNNLKSKYDASTADLGTTRNLSYLLVLTTIVFIATTAYLAIRKPKVKPELKAT